MKYEKQKVAILKECLQVEGCSRKEYIEKFFKKDTELGGKTGLFELAMLNLNETDRELLLQPAKTRNPFPSGLG